MNEIFLVTTTEYGDDDTVYDIGVFTKYSKAVSFARKYKKKFPKDRVYVYTQELDPEFTDDTDFSYHEEDNNAVEVLQ